ncbi:DUF4339 domain-containing protein [Thermophilibacter sp.]
MDEGSFYSIDRLVEFGLSVAVATQMANSMNVGLQGTLIPGARNPMQPGERPLFYVVLDGKSVGPLATPELLRLIAERRVTKETYVWRPGMTDWQLAEDVPEVLKLVALTPPPVPVRAHVGDRDM